MINTKFTFLALTCFIALSLNSCREIEESVSVDNNDIRPAKTAKEEFTTYNALRRDSLNITNPNPKDTIKIKHRYHNNDIVFPLKNSK